MERNCGCEYCKNNLSFDLPPDIIDATIKGDLVIFAGAGISTESKKVFKESLYEDIVHDMLLSNEKLDFPSLMTIYCKKNINGRQKLLQKIKFRFDYCHQFSELYNQASQFHQELSSIFHINSIFTTNWDDYFERECAAVPIVVPEDFAFHNIPDRKVYKIHGSISNYGSIIATKEDYDKCYKELDKGILGSYMKTILATKVIVFIGYSFRDYDFLKIYNYLQKELKDILPHCYIVTLDSNAGKALKNTNVTIINTDGTYFISAIRKHLEGTKHLLPKENIQRVRILRRIVSDIHGESSIEMERLKQPNLIYCAFYQDGIMHALDYLIFHSNSGKSFNPLKIFNSIDTYQDVLRKKKLKEKNYPDVAYIDGYICGLMSIIMDTKIKDFPFWYLHGIGPISDKKFYEKSIKKNEIFHKTAEAFGLKHFKKVLDHDSNLVYHHTPFL